MMNIRYATQNDLNDLAVLYACAREKMKANKNPHQWGDNQPAMAVLQQDIAKKQLYVLDEQNKIYGAFAFIIGDDPTYQMIYDGYWLNDLPYGTIHRLASNGQHPHLFKNVLQFCEQKITNIRIDTHADNTIMQHLLKKYGFAYCGIIHVEDGSPRLAYQKSKKEL